MKKITSQCAHSLGCLFGDLNSVAIALVDQQGNLLDANSGFVQLLGMAPQSDMRNTCVADYFTRPTFSELIAALLESENSSTPRQQLLIGNHESGSQNLQGTLRKWQDAYLLVAEHDYVSFDKINNLMVELNEELENKRRQLSLLTQELESKEPFGSDLMVPDPLTDLPNRRHLEQYLAQEFARSDRENLPLSLVITGIDNFGYIRSQMGHEAGEFVLHAFARCIKETVRTGDFVARLDYDEFAIVYPNTDLDQAIDVTNRVRQGASGRISEQVTVDITASYGIAERRIQEEPYSVLRHAKQAFSRAKHNSENRIVHYLPGDEGKKPLAN